MRFLCPLQTCSRMSPRMRGQLFGRSFFVAAHAEALGLSARPIGPDGTEIGAKEVSPRPEHHTPNDRIRNQRALSAVRAVCHLGLWQVPGAFFSHAGRLTNYFGVEQPHVDHNTWPVGVVSPQQLGSADLRAFEASLRARTAAIGGGADGEDAIVCTLSRGAWRDADGFAWDRVGRSECREWHFLRGAEFTSVSLLAYHGGKVGPWSPDKTPPRLPSHNQWNLYFEADDRSSHYFLYSALIHDPYQRLRRMALREMLLMMNWRIVTSHDGVTISQAQLSVRRQSPLAIILMSVGGLVLVCFLCGRVRKGKRD